MIWLHRIVIRARGNGCKGRVKLRIVSKGEGFENNLIVHTTDSNMETADEPRSVCVCSRPTEVSSDEGTGNNGVCEGINPTQVSTTEMLRKKIGVT